MTPLQIIVALIAGASASMAATRVTLETVLHQALQFHALGGLQPTYSKDAMADLHDTVALARVLERRLVHHQHLMQAAARDEGINPSRQVFVMFGRDIADVQRIQQLCALHDDPVMRAFAEQLAGGMPGPELPTVRPAQPTKN